MTQAESVLWSLLRRSRLGTRFRRQEPIGRFVVDFVSLSRRLVIELDGQGHYEGLGEYDVVRDQFLEARGFRVLHVENRVVFVQPDDLLDEIRRLVEDLEAMPTPGWA